MERLVKFEILGHEYPFYTDAPEDELQQVITLVRTQLEENCRNNKNMLPTNKLAVLASLNIAGKYVRLKKEFEQYRQATEGCVERLTVKIENSLTPEGTQQEKSLAL